MKTFISTLALALAASGWACGPGDDVSSDSSDTAGSSTGGYDTGGDDTGTSGTTSEPTAETCRSEVTFPWLAEGNFWEVAWSEIDATISAIRGGTGSWDVGSYSMVLGAPRLVSGMQMYPLSLSGDIEKYTPRWVTLGTDGCGNLWGQRSAGATPLKVYTTGRWSGNGFYTDYAGFDASSVHVATVASMLPSQYTDTASHFGPLAAVGYTDSSVGPGGTGCEYFEGYGTICGSDAPGDYADETAFEYWDAAAGPVGMHLSRNYVEGGALSDERHSEKRVEVWFFGDTVNTHSELHHEPDSCVDATSIPLDNRIFTAYGEIHRYDIPAGNVPGCDQPLSSWLYGAIQSWYPYAQDTGMQIAQRVNDWYAFEIVDPGKRVEFYLVWDDPAVNLDFHWFAASDNTTYGEFVYFGDESIVSTEPNIGGLAQQKGIPNPTVAGRYLLGVTRTTPSQFATPYGIGVFTE